MAKKKTVDIAAIAAIISDLTPEQIDSLNNLLQAQLSLSLVPARWVQTHIQVMRLAAELQAKLTVSQENLTRAKDGRILENLRYIEAERSKGKKLAAILQRIGWDDAQFRQYRKRYKEKLNPPAEEVKVVPMRLHFRKA